MCGCSLREIARDSCEADSETELALRLVEIEPRLLRENFHRIHRSYIANLNCITELMRVEGGYVVVATDRDATHIPVARREIHSFREIVGI